MRQISREFPRGPVARTPCFHCWAQVQFLVGELGSYKVWPKTRKRLLVSPEGWEDSATLTLRLSLLLIHPLHHTHTHTHTHTHARTPTALNNRCCPKDPQLHAESLNIYYLHFLNTIISGLSLIAYAADFLDFVEMATHSSTLAWKIPWTEKPGGLQSMGLQRVGYNWATSLHFRNT